jgi:hypothetical protein
MPRRSIRTFTLDGGVQDRLDALVADFGARRLGSLLPAVGILPPAAQPIIIDPSPPVLDKMGLTAENYDALYKEFLSATPVSQRNHEWKAFWHNAYQWCARGNPRQPLFDLNALHVAIKEMKYANRRAVWRAKQTVCHRRAKTVTAVEPERIAASRLVDRLLTLGMDELEERATRRDNKEKPQTVKETTSDRTDCVAKQVRRRPTTVAGGHHQSGHPGKVKPAKTPGARPSRFGRLPTT